MSYEEKLYEVFKQLSFLQFQTLKQLPEEEINELYETRPFKEGTPDEKEKTDLTGLLNLHELLNNKEEDNEEEVDDDIPECIKSRIKNNLN